MDARTRVLTVGPQNGPASPARSADAAEHTTERLPAPALNGPTMHDVARLAGVSHQTVSRVLNGSPNVRQRTRSLVETAISQLGYRPNRAARSLVTGASRAVGVVVRSPMLYGHAATLSCLAEEAVQRGFSVNVEFVRSLGRQPVADAVGRHLDHRVAGLVVIAPVQAASEVLESLPENMPLVTIDGDPARPAGLVTVDHEAGAHAATRYLLEAGHATVWHVSGPVDWFDARARIAGWRRALTEAGAEVPPLLPADWLAASGYRNGQVLARMPDATAVFAANDRLAQGILRAMREAGRRVPEDVSVAGFDDVPEAAQCIPPLTTVRPDFGAVARASLDLLLAQINIGSRLCEHRILAPMLVRRDSVAQPRRLAWARRRPDRQGRTRQ